VTLAALVGCASPLAGRAWNDETDLSRLRRAASSAEGGPARSTGKPPLPDAPALDDYVRVALRRNPSIRAAKHRVRSMGARVPQVTSLDDPMLHVAPFGEMAQTAAGEVGVMAGVSQKLPFPGKLDARGRIAEQDVAMALAQLHQVRLRVAGQTRRAYWSYYESTRAVEATRQSQRLLKQFERIARTEYEAGTRSQQDVLRASVELAELEQRLIELAQQQATARAMLNQLMDRPVRDALPEPARTEPEQLTEQLDALLRIASQTNPGIRRIQQRIEQYRQRTQLARLNRWPDLTVSASYNFVEDEGLSPVATGDDQWWFGFGINVPIWAAKHDAAEREALHGRLESAADLAAERNRVSFEVQDAYLRVESQQRLVALFSDQIIPQARQTVEASRSGYRAGDVDFLTLTDNWRKLLHFELMYHRAVAQMHRAAADLEQAVGRDVDRDQPAPQNKEITP